MYIVVVYEDGRRWYFNGAALYPRRIDAYKFESNSEAQAVADRYGENAWVEKY